MKKLLVTGLLTLAFAGQASAEADYQALGSIATKTAQKIDGLISRVGQGAAPSSGTPSTPTGPSTGTPAQPGSWNLENDSEVVSNLKLASERLREGANHAFSAQQARIFGNIKVLVEEGAFACGAVNRAWSMLSIANAKAFAPEPFGGPSRYLPFGQEIASYRDDINAAYSTHCK